MAAASVGVVAALPAEARRLEPVGDGQTSRVSVAVSGMGTLRAARAARGLLAGGADALASWGVAAGLVEGLAPGAVVIPERIVEAHGRVHVTSPPWVAALARALAGGGPEVHGGLLVEVEAVLTTPAAKAQAAAGGAVAADMESAAVAAVAAAAGVPFIAVRAISDAVDHALPTAAVVALAPDGSLRPWSLAAAVARRPGDWPSLVRLGLAFHAALDALGRVRSRGGRALLEPPR